jgi:hypothetical protein
MVPLELFNIQVTAKLLYSCHVMKQGTWQYTILVKNKIFDCEYLLSFIIEIPRFKKGLLKIAALFI